ncbi:MAG TPA: hypothetical protein VK206_26910 [Anaerolineales bacterium]|nr:hypothetical protein [Anaerolineales bacterium]HLO29744.1 hypothetical protein [Anaerolineales bacterium]
MDPMKITDEASIDGAVQLLRQILELYKEMGPHSMESLTKSYLASAPTAETAENAAEEMMAQAFRIFDAAVDSTLRVFAARQGFDLAASSNYKRRMEEGYFRVAYPAIVMYTAWLDHEGQKKAIENLDKIFQSTMLGVAGYMILDSNLDEQTQNAAEILLSLSFIQEHDKLLLESFEFDRVDYELLGRFKQLYLMAEIKEKRSRFVRSPYTKEHPEDCGYKAVHGYLPFALLLQKSGKADQIDDYLRFFYEWGAPLQIMDDIIDLEEDLKNGHYSYPVLGFEKELSSLSPGELAALIRSDVEHLEQLQFICQGLIDSSREQCIKLKADFMRYFVDMLEARLDVFFSEILKGQSPNDQH